VIEAMSPRTGGRSPRIEAVVFDMDGVIFEGRNFWLDLHRRYFGDVSAAEEAVARHIDDYDLLAAKIVGDMWKGRPAQPYEELVAERSYQPGVRQALAGLRRHGIKTAIVSTGPDRLAARAQRDLGIDLFRANGVEVSAGRLTGKARIRVPELAKGEVGVEVLRELGVDPARTAAVGDSTADKALALAVGMPIAYDSNSTELSQVAHHRLNHGEMELLPEILGADIVS
jgi:phosphoserine phosphatase